MTFNNHQGSTKSYASFEHNDAMPVDFIPRREAITTSYDAGVVRKVCMHDGSVLRLQKVNEEYNAEMRSQRWTPSPITPKRIVFLPACSILTVIAKSSTCYLRHQPLSWMSQREMPRVEISGQH